VVPGKGKGGRELRDPPKGSTSTFFSGRRSTAPGRGRVLSPRIEEGKKGKREGKKGRSAAACAQRRALHPFSFGRRDGSILAFGNDRQRRKEEATVHPT